MDINWTFSPRALGYIASAIPADCLPGYIIFLRQAEVRHIIRACDVVLSYLMPICLRCRHVTPLSLVSQRRNTLADRLGCALAKVV